MTRWGIVFAGVVLSSCGGKPVATVGETVLAQASHIIEAKPGATIEVGEAEIDSLPEDDVIRLAIGRKVPWHRAKAIIDRVQQAGKEPVILVGWRHKTGAMKLESDSLRGDGSEVMRVFGYIDGKVCVQPPDTDEAACVAPRPPMTVIPANYVREITRKVESKYDLQDVVVSIPDTLNWYNTVLLIDAVHTCCKGIEMHVKLGD